MKIEIDIKLKHKESFAKIQMRKRH